mmetsp:Transcript_6382/g.9678  ORF Transcript_6382/g.9678 Transcript_6382/m.9678 type:complete len:274 (-) Transcript_6382:172-993(-)
MTRMLQEYSRDEASGQGWQEHFVDQLRASKTSSVGSAVSQCLSYVTLSNFATADEMLVLHQAAMDVKLQSFSCNDDNDGTYVLGATEAAHHNCTRFSVEALLNSNAKIVSAVFLNRLLGFLGGASSLVGHEKIQEIVELGSMVFGHNNWKNSKVKWYAEPDDTGTLHPEPKVNIYESGGYFKSHEDGMDLTLLVVLNDSFEGGGTAFYCHHEDDEESKTPDRVERPKAGTAIIWGGSLRHMGLPITSGQRSIFVGSFDLEEEEGPVLEDELAT